MRVDPAGERGEARLGKQALLLFELFFIPRAVPDFQRDEDGKDGRQINHEDLRQIGRGGRQQKDILLEEARHAAAHAFGYEHAGEKEEVERGATVVLAFLEEAVNAEIEKRKPPDVVGTGGKVAQEA